MGRICIGLGCAGTIAVAAAYIVVTPSYEVPQPISSWKVSLSLAPLSTLFAFALPRLKAGGLCHLWKVPRSTFVFHRSVLIAGFVALLGQASGAVAVGVAWDESHLPLALLTSFATLAWGTSLQNRLAQPAATEFHMPSGDRRLVSHLRRSNR